MEAVVRQMPDAVVICEAPSGRILLTNRENLLAERHTGPASIEQLAERWELRHLDGRPYTVEEWQLVRSLRTGEEIVGEEFLLAGEHGALRTFSCNCSPVYDDTGQMIAAVSVSRDITEYKAREQRLAFHAGLLDNTLDAIVAVDAEWYLTAWNKGAERMYGWSAEEVLGRHTLEVAQLDMSYEERALVRQAVAEQGRWRGEVTVRRKDGTTVTIELITVAIPGGDGRPSGFLSIHRDISERRDHEARHARWIARQERLAALGLRALAHDHVQDLMSDAAGVVAETLSVEMVGIAEILPGGEELLLRAGVGWRSGAVGIATGSAGRHSLVGYTLMTGGPVVSEDVRADERFDISSVLREHGPAGAACVIIAGRDEPFGALAAFSRTARQFSSDEVHFLQAVANVISTTVERAQGLRQLREVREAERSRMARDLHDEALRELTDAMAEAYRAQAESTDPAAAERIGRVAMALGRAGQQLRAAIHDLRLAGDEDRPFPDLLNELVALTRARSADCEVTLDVREGMPVEALGDDGTELLRIVAEALTNARRHSGARRIDVVARGSASLVCVEISDDGSGFDPHRLPATATSAGIIGMHERSAALGAELDIRSTPGEGTRVRVELPLGRTGAATPDAVRVLLVDDHVTVREAVAAALEREEGFEIVGQAASLAEARGMLAGVDVALVDLGLPDGYGGDLIRELRDATPAAQALVLSANLDRGQIARAIESGAAGAVSKTAGLDEVVRAVRRLHAGETLIPLPEVVELLRFAGRQREEEYSGRQALASLTPREREVLQLLAEGLDSRHIAERLFISVRTERNHIASILAKLGVHSRLQAVVLGARYGVVQMR